MSSISLFKPILPEKANILQHETVVYERSYFWKGFLTIMNVSNETSFDANAEDQTNSNGPNYTANSLAFHLLDQFTQDGVLSCEKAEFHKEKYALLHNCVLETYKREKELLKKAKTLNNDLLSEKIKLEKQSIRKAEESMLVGNLQKEKEKAEKEFADCVDRDTVLTYEVTELQREHAELLHKKEEVQHENAKKIEPEIQKVTEEISKLSEEFNRVEALTLKESRRKKEFSQKNDILTEQKTSLEEVRGKGKRELMKIKADPDRIRKQGDVIQKATENLEAELKRIQQKIQNADDSLTEQGFKQKEAEDVQKELNHKLDLHRETIEQRQRDVDHVKTHLGEEKATHHLRINSRLELDMEYRAADESLRRENERLNTATKEFDRLKKSLKKKQMICDSAKSILPNLRNQVTDCEHQVQAYKHENKKLKLKSVEMKQEVDVFIAKFLKQEGIEKGKKEELEQLIEEVKSMESELSKWVFEENKQNKIVAMLSAQREIKAREASKAVQNEKETQQDLKMKELVILDLAKKCNETNNRLKEFSALYDVVKNERNKYVNLIQASSQALAEMKEKIKILQNEVEVLRNESLAKDKALVKEKLAHQTAKYNRDSLRLDTNKCHSLYKIKQECVEQQIVEIDKLNSIINIMEKDMLSLKKKYEIAIDTRNYTGVQLIDRNDELCILYEKSNIQEKYLKEGEIGIRKKEQEIRMMNLQLSEIQRHIEISRKQIPKVPEHAEKILKLQEELNMEREITEMICRDLETPKNVDRWRALGGDDPDEDQLSSKIQVLEERLSSKKEQLLEKELVLEEVTSLADKLRLQASEGRGDTLQLAKKVNNFQAKIKDTTRKMMATVSELSMFQATAMKLQQEKHDRQIILEESEWNFEQGAPPNEACEQEWYRRERERLRKEELSYQKSKAANNVGHIPSNATRTTAEPRPNAYIPEDLGVPKPYGASAPLKPTEPGSTMRHIRVPKPQDVEI